MQKRSLSLSLIAISCFLTAGTVLADNTATSGSTAVSGSAAIGAQSNNVGGFGIAGANVDQQFNSEGTDIPVTLPGMPGVGVPTPQVFSFGPLSNPTNINNIAPSMYFEKKCQPEYTKGNDSYTDAGAGWSGKTEVVFTSYPDYKKKRATNGSPARVLPRFPAASGNYVCIGVIMTTAEKGSESKVNINVVRDDTVKYVFSNLEGYSEIYIVSPELSIGTALGMGTEGNGFSLGGAAAGIVGSSNPALGAVLGLAAAFSKSAASTHPDGRIGATYWVLGKPKDPEAGTPFSDSEFAAYFQELVKSSMPPSAEGNGKKLEAVK